MAGHGSFPSLSAGIQVNTASIAYRTASVGVQGGIRAVMVAAALERGMLRLSRQGLRVFHSADDLALASGHTLQAPQVQRLMDSGVVFATGSDLATGERTFVALYEEAILARGTAKEVEEGLKPLAGKRGKGLGKALNSLVRISDESIATLTRMADKALDFPKAKKPNVCAVLEGPNGERFFNYSLKAGLPEGVFPDGLHPLVRNWVDERWMSFKNGLAEVGNGHGKCAEVLNVSDFLKSIDPKGKMTIIEAQEALKGFKSHARKIDDLFVKKVLKEKHLDYKKACDSCNPFLKHFNINEVK
jgi:hypothetical protein